jgi:LPXTG-site transpeptidase (sortase) family protein
MTTTEPRQFRARALRWLKQPVAPRTELDDVTGALRSRDLKRMRKPAEYFLGLVAVVALGYCTAQYSAAAIHQSRQNARLDALREQSALLDKTLNATPVSSDANSGPPPIGRIEIPRVGVSAIVEEGDSDATLAESVGHLTGTALPGQSGNIALAAHRDTYFRDLEDIQAGDEIYFTTARAIYKYRVTSRDVVDPSDVAVLAPSSDARLTLITCYPFHFVGPAPKRFVVVASLEK